MFKAQEVLNKKYNGENWKDGITMGKSHAAIMDEVSEFLREIEPRWKWWSGRALEREIDQQAALFELIDIIHFAMMIVLYRHKLDHVIYTLDDDFDYHPSAFVEIVDADDHVGRFTQAVIQFLKDSPYAIRWTMIRRLIDIIETGGTLLRLEPGQIFEAYQLKNQLNHKRVEGGQKQGKYDKSQEQKLSIGD